MELTFGQRISGLTVDGKELHAAVFNENEVRAAAGLTMVIGAVAFAYAYFDQQLRAAPGRRDAVLRRVPDPAHARDPVQPGRRHGPRDDVGGQPPEWVSAKPKRFAWTLGLAHVVRR